MKFRNFLSSIVIGSSAANATPCLDLTSSEIMSNWQIVNDGVMGGLSSGSLQLSKKGYAIFSGNVSLDNNGGFTSIRHRLEQPISVKGKQNIIINVKGDGKRYQLRIKSAVSEKPAYVSYFVTNGDWQSIIIPLNNLYPTFRGRDLELPNFNSQQIAELGFLIANKTAESFQLQIKSICFE